MTDMDHFTHAVSHCPISFLAAIPKFGNLAYRILQRARLYGPFMNVPLCNMLFTSAFFISSQSIIYQVFLLVFWLYCSSDYVMRIEMGGDNLTDQIWYHGLLTREAADSLLEIDGDFLVRCSTMNQSNDIVLSCKWVRIERQRNFSKNCLKTRSKNFSFENLKLTFVNWKFNWK